MKRKKQYERKLNFIVEKIENLPRNPKKNEFYMDALFYRLQVAIDASFDLIAMVCKDMGIKVNDDYSNLEELESKGIFKAEILNELRKFNGLRNALAHKYNKIEEKTVLNQKSNIKSTLKRFLGWRRMLVKSY
ncbi:MAG: DUF86 domain-containing protein [Promethearchaeia archaeon]